MIIFLRLVALLFPFKNTAVENFVPDSILDGLQAEVLAGLDSVIFDGEYIFEDYQK